LNWWMEGMREGVKKKGARGRLESGGGRVPGNGRIDEGRGEELV
jgi:hypothetical protein